MTTELEEFLRSPAAAEATADAEGRLLRPGTVLDGMEVVAFLGAGATAEVWRVRKDGRDLALKMLRPDARNVDSARERFLTEARLLTEFAWPGVVKAYELNESAANPYFTLDFLRPLPERLGERALVKLLDEVCLALDGLHRKGIIHRDVKPGNVLLDESGRAVVADLGLVHLGDDDVASVVQTAGAHNLTIAGGDRFVGTPGYAAPEQLAGQDVSPASDIYALGVMASRLLGDRPPRAWRSFIRRSTSAVPPLRYADMPAVRRALRYLRYRRPLQVAFVAAFAFAGVALWMLYQGASVGTVPMGSPPEVVNVIEKQVKPSVFGVELGEETEIPSSAQRKGAYLLVPFHPTNQPPAYALFQGYRKFVRPLEGDTQRGQTLMLTATSFIAEMSREELDRRQPDMAREWADVLKQLQGDLYCTFAKQPTQGNHMVWKSHLDRPGFTGQAEAHFAITPNANGTYQILRLVTISATDCN